MIFPKIAHSVNPLDSGNSCSVSDISSAKNDIREDHLIFITGNKKHNVPFADFCNEQVYIKQNS